MAEKVYISAVTGLAVSLQLYQGAVAVGAAFSATEIGTTGEYVADFPLGIPYGNYLVVASVGTGVKIASGEIGWTGQYEWIDALAKLEGLDAANPMNVTKTSRTVGDISLAITGEENVDITVTNEP